jgi:hypothetical protein
VAPECHSIILHQENGHSNIFIKSKFTLTHTVSESDVPCDLIKRVLRLDDNKSSQDNVTSEKHLIRNDEEEDLQAKRSNLVKRNSLHLLLRSGEHMVDKPRCEFKTWPFAKVKTHAIVSLILLKFYTLHQLFSPKFVTDDAESLQLKWKLSLQDNCKPKLGLLKEDRLESPWVNWIIDFEFLSIREKSPIPLQVSIRQFNSKTILSTNVDYRASLNELIEVASAYTGAHMGPFLVRLYESYGTNGMKPSQIRARIF